VSKQPSHSADRAAAPQQQRQSQAVDEPQPDEHDERQPEPLDPQEIEALLRGGTKMCRRGDPEHWVTVTRVGDKLAIAYALTDEALADLVKQDLVVLAE
jgi:ribosomal protein S25